MNNIIKSITLTLTSLAAGFIAITIPFNLIGTLSKEAMHIVFISEIVIYFSVAMIFLVASDKKKQQEIKSNERHKERRRKIEEVKKDWIDIAA